MNRITMAALVLIAIGWFGCGGSDESCNFEIADFTNGANASTATSFWNCNSSNMAYTFAFYDDGAGYSSALGAFTWEEAGCREVDINAVDGTSQIRDIDGSIASGIGTFKQIHPDGSESTASCVLETTEAQSINTLDRTSSTQLALKTECSEDIFAQALQLVHLTSGNWIIMIEDEVLATFIDSHPFRISEWECSLKHDEILCYKGNCILQYN